MNWGDDDEEDEDDEIDEDDEDEDADKEEADATRLEETATILPRTSLSSASRITTCLEVASSSALCAEDLVGVVIIIVIEGRGEG